MIKTRINNDYKFKLHEFEGLINLKIGRNDCLNVWINQKMR